MTDPIDRLAGYRPTTTTLDAEWGPSERALLRDQLMNQPATQGRLRFVPRRRWPAVAAIASGAALVTGLAAVIVAVAGNGSGSGPAGAPFDASTTRETPRVGAGQYAYRAVSTYQVDAKGKGVVTGTIRDWVAADGTIWSIRSGEGAGEAGCFRFDWAGTPSLSTPNRAFLDRLPTERAALQDWLRNTVDGSTSRDEAIFVGAGDLLRTSDLLASTDLRAAYVEVLSRTGYVAVHPDATDYLGRPAVRADFVDQNNRPHEISSLYFDPATFQLLEERSGSDGASADPVSASTSAAWASVGPQPSTASDLPGPAWVTVMTDEKVVDALPAEARACTPDGGAGAAVKVSGGASPGTTPPPPH